MTDDAVMMMMTDDGDDYDGDGDGDGDDDYGYDDYDYGDGGYDEKVDGPVFTTIPRWWFFCETSQTKSVLVVSRAGEKFHLSPARETTRTYFFGHVSQNATSAEW